MMTTTRRTGPTISALVVALALTAFSQSIAIAQDDPVADSAKQAEAFKAMEAAADSARNAAARGRGPAGAQPGRRVAEGPKPPDTAQQVSDSTAETEGAANAARETAINAAKPLEALGDSAGKSVPDTSDEPTPASTPANSAKTVVDTTAGRRAPSRPADTGATKSTTVPDDTTLKLAEAKPPKPVDPTAPYKDVKFATGEKPRVVIETTLGKVILELWPEVAPKHCQNFVYQVTNGFYDSLTIHRVVPGYLIQGGDPEGTGMGGPGYSVPAEFSAKQLHDEGTLSMARRIDPAAKTGAAEKPEFLNSAGSQFFICLARTASLDGKFTVFGKVVEGLDVIHAIEKTPTQRERPVAPVLMSKVYLEPKA